METAMAKNRSRKLEHREYLRTAPPLAALEAALGYTPAPDTTEEEAEEKLRAAGIERETAPYVFESFAERAARKREAADAVRREARRRLDPDASANPAHDRVYTKPHRQWENSRDHRAIYASYCTFYSRLTPAQAADLFDRALLAGCFVNHTTGELYCNHVENLHAPIHLQRGRRPADCPACSGEA